MAYSDKELDYIKSLYATGKAEDRIEARNMINRMTDLRPSCPHCFSGHLDNVGISKGLFSTRRLYRCDRCGYTIEK